jgi:hypothetical protein
MMKISFESEIVMPYISRAILSLTDCSTVNLDDVHYDETLKIVEIYLQRREIKRFFWLWGRVERVFGQDKVKSLLRIKQVESVDIDVDDRLVIEHDSTFTVFVGVQMNSNEVYLGSLEESRGKILCKISIKVKKLDIEYSEAVVKM